MASLIKSLGVGTFWAKGQLTALDQACLLSFVNSGYSLTLFSYEKIVGVPEGVLTADAAEIVPSSMMNRVLYNGRPDLAHFSDVFRYAMIEKANLVWIDMDVLLIRDRDFPNSSDLIVREKRGGINGAVLYISDSELRRLTSEMLKLKLDRDLKWGETGPIILTKAIKDSRISVKLIDPEYFYPLDYSEIWKILLPSYSDECSSKCQEALTLHMFNNILNTMGYWKNLAPPVGSFLYSILKQQDLLKLFDATYPEHIMIACKELRLRAKWRRARYQNLAKAASS